METKNREEEGKRETQETLFNEGDLEYNPRVIERVTRFFELRFPKKNIQFEKQCGYFYEWCDRWMSGHPDIWMDAESLKAYKQVIGEL